MKDVHRATRNTRLAFVLLVCCIVVGERPGRPPRAAADSCEVIGDERPAPGFGRVRFFNGSSTSRPAAVTGTASTSGGGSYQASPGTASPNGTSAFVDGSGRTDVISTKTKIAIGAATITVENVAPTGWHVMESQVLLVDDAAGKVRAEGRCLVAKTGAFKWVSGTTTDPIPMAATSTGPLTTKLELRDLTVLNGSADRHDWTMPYGNSSYPDLVLGPSFVDSGQLAGTWASTGQVVTRTELYIDSKASPLAQLTTASGESIFLSVFLLESGTGTAVTATATGVVQSSQAPYWVFR